MASILKATSTIGAKALKPLSGSVKKVSNKLEHLSKDYDDRGSEKLLWRKLENKVDKGKWKAIKEPHKKRKLTHSSGSSFVSLGPLPHSSKATVSSPKLMKFSKRQ